MKISGIKGKPSLLGLGILMFCMLCAPACAHYSYEGFPLDTIRSGTGEVYVSCGDNAGLQGTSYQSNTFVTKFTNVPTGDVEWAELKVGVWGGSTSRVGRAEANLDGYSLFNETLRANSTVLSNNVDCSGSGIYLIHYNCTNLINQYGINGDGNITATVTTTPGSPALDGRVYGAVLIVAYNNGSSSQYWINQGNLNLHKNVTSGGTYYPDLDANITRFNGAVNTSLGNATLTVGYFAGDSSQKDYLYFNPPQNAYSPYNLSNFNWNIGNYELYQLDGDNVANGTCDTIGFTTKNFDLHTFDVTVTNSSNYAVFWRGHGNNNNETEIYDPAWPGVNPNTESYVSPFLAVLKIKP